MAAALAIATLGVAAGCGDDSDDGAAASAPTVATAPAADVVEVSAYLSDSAPEADRVALRARIDDLVAAGDISAFEYVAKEQALEDLRARLDDPSILDDLPSNPLPDVIRIDAPDDAAAARVEAALRDEPALDPELGVRSAIDIPEELLP